MRPRRAWRIRSGARSRAWLRTSGMAGDVVRDGGLHGLGVGGAATGRERVRSHRPPAYPGASRLHLRAVVFCPFLPPLPADGTGMSPSWQVRADVRALGRIFRSSAARPGRGHRLRPGRRRRAHLLPRRAPRRGGDRPLGRAGRPRGVLVPGDLADADHCRSVIDTAVTEFGRVDFLVSNAGAAAHPRQARGHNRRGKTGPSPSTSARSST